MSKFLKARLLAIPAFALATGTSAMAAVPAEVTTAVTALKDDGVSIATLVLLAVVAIFAIKFLRKGL